MNKTKHVLLLILAFIFVIVAAAKLVSGDLKGCAITIVIGAFAIPIIIKFISKEDSTDTK